jgi:hypothetical protein
VELFLIVNEKIFNILKFSMMKNKIKIKSLKKQIKEIREKLPFYRT